MILKSTRQAIYIVISVAWILLISGHQPVWADRRADYLTHRLIDAIYSGDEADVLQLLKLGAQPNRVSPPCSHPLIEAITDSRISIARLLIQHGAKLSAKDGIWAQCYCTNNWLPEMLRLVLQSGVKPDIYDRSTVHIPAPYFMDSEQQEIFGLLDSAGARKGVIAATRLHDNRLLRDLLYLGADPESKSAEGKTALMWAATVDEPELALEAAPLELLLSYGADPNPADPRGRTALMYAAQAGTYFADEAVESLIKAGANLEARDHDGATALILAANNGRDKTVKVLLNFGANIEARDHQGRTPLIAAADWSLGIEGSRYHNYGEAVPVLLANGADVNASDRDGVTPLHIAARNGQSEDQVKMLISAGADPNIADKDGLRALTWECYYRNKANITALRAAGAKVGLVEAILLEDDGEIKRLIEGGANVNGRGPYGQTALMIAARKGLTDVCRQLLDAGANIHARDKQGNTALHCACGATEWWIRYRFPGYSYPSMTSNKENTALLSLLLDRGIDPNISNKQGETALFWAIDNGYALVNQQLFSGGTRATSEATTLALRQAVARHRPATVSLLLQHSTSPNFHTKAQFSPLQVAIWEKEPDIAQKLVDAGADTNTRTPHDKTYLFTPYIPRDETPLLLAANRGVWDLVPSLLTHGANPDDQGADGTTALSRAAYNGKLKAVKELLAAHANPRIKDYEYKTPRDYAVEQNHSEIVALLDQPRH